MGQYSDFSMSTYAPQHNGEIDSRSACSVALAVPP